MLKAEYIVVFNTARNLISIHEILAELNMIVSDFTFSLLMNNNSIITVSNDEKITTSAKHINIQYHHIQNLIKKNIIEVFYIFSKQMTVNEFIKAFNKEKFIEFCKMIDIVMKLISLADMMT